MMKNFILFILILTLLSASACSKANDQTEGRRVSAADFTLPGIGAEEISLSDLLRNKKAVLIFWASWCYYCRKELPRAEKFYLENKDKVTVIGINIGESKAKTQGIVRKMELSYPTALDIDGSVAKLYNLRGVPTVIAIDQEGKIIYFGHSIEEMRKRIGL